MGTSTKSTAEHFLSARVAGEDLRRGDYVARFTHTYEVPSYMWDHGDFALAPNELVRLTFVPHEAGRPLKIIGLSLPFVYAVAPDDSVETLDVRRTQVVRLAPRCAKTVWKRMKSRQSDSRNRKGRK